MWVNDYHAYPAGAAFGGYKSSGIGRENHSMMLDHYQQTKNLTVSYNEDTLGFFNAGSCNISAVSPWDPRPEQPRRKP